MRSWTPVVAGLAVLAAVAGCATDITGQPGPRVPDGGNAQVASVADLGTVVRHSADAKRSVHVEGSVSVPDQGVLTAVGDATFGGDHASAQITMNLPGLGQFDLVVVDTAVYMKLPASMLSELNLPAAKPWVETPLDGTTGSSALGSTVNLATEMDPTHMIEEIKSAGRITGTTQEEVNGVQTTHYAITVDVKTLAETMTDNPGEEAALSQATVPTIPFDLWVDTSDLPVRIVSTMFLTGTATAKPHQVTQTTNYSDWGEQVSVNAPPADEVTPIGGH